LQVLPSGQHQHPSQLQIALKNNVGIHYFGSSVLLHSTFVEDVDCDQVVSTFFASFIIE
jgi:hypothetical protein